MAWDNNIFDVFGRKNKIKDDYNGVGALDDKQLVELLIKLYDQDMFFYDYKRDEMTICHKGSEAIVIDNYQKTGMYKIFDAGDVKRTTEKYQLNRGVDNCVRTYDVKSRIFEGTSVWYRITSITKCIDETPIKVIGRIAELNNLGRNEVFSVPYGKQLEGAIESIYALVISLNFTKGTCVYIYSDTDIELKSHNGYIDEAFGRIEPIIHPDDYKEYMSYIDINRYKEKGSSYKMEYRELTTDGEYHWMEATFTRIDIVNSNDINMLLLIRNIDEKKNIEANMEKATIAARKANSAKSEFLSRISHDIRTPLNGIIGMAEIGTSADTIEEQRECLCKIKSASKYLFDIINELMDISKIESGSIEYTSSKFNFMDMINELKIMGEMIASEKDVKMDFSIEGMDNTIYLGDSVHIKQIVMNLLSNAVKFNSIEGQVHVTGSIKPIDQDKAWIDLTVADTGRGMSEDFISYAFEAYIRENEVGDESISGAGLGLYIVKQHIDRLGGTIEIQSEIGVGTSIHIGLPIDVDNAGMIKASQYSISDDILVGKRVLLAEDNELNLEIALKLLEKKGMIVDATCDGKEAFDAYCNSEEGFYDILILDIRMPVMYGDETARRIKGLDRRDSKTVPIIALTADVINDKTNVSSRQVFDSIIPKPIQVSKLYDTIIYHLSNKL